MIASPQAEATPRPLSLCQAVHSCQHDIDLGCDKRIRNRERLLKQVGDGARVAAVAGRRGERRVR